MNILAYLRTLAAKLFHHSRLPDRLAPYNSAVGILVEAAPKLWLLVMGVNSHQWKTQAHAAEEL